MEKDKEEKKEKKEEIATIFIQPHDAVMDWSVTFDSEPKKDE